MKRLILLASLGLWAGCNLAPKYNRPPDSATPAAFKEATPVDPQVGFRLAQPSDQRLRGAWWEVYDDPVLNQLEVRVATANQSVIAAAATYRQARALVTEARAGYFPTVTAAPSVTRSRASAGAGGASPTVGATTTTSSSSAGASSSTGGTSTTGTSSTGSNSGTASSTGSTASSTAGSTRTLYILPIDASYEVDLWGRVRNTVQQNATLAEASAADWANELLSMQAELAQDYFGLRAADEQRRLLTTTLNDYRASLSLVDTLFKNGLASDEDVAEAQLQLDTAQVQATDLAITRAQYEHAIAVLVGVPPTRFSLAELPLVPRVPVIPLTVPSDLLERRPDVAGAERRVASANAGIGIARAAYFPSLTLSASAGFESLNLSNLLDWPQRFWSVGPALAQTLFDGGARRAETARARAAYDENVADYRQTVLAAFQSVEDSLINLRVLYDEARQEHSAVQAAERAVRLSVTRYKQGIDSYVNVITAQNAFLVSRQGELTVQLRALTASVGLVKNLGGGWPKPKSREADPSKMTPDSATPDPESIPDPMKRSMPNPPPETLKTRPEDLLNQDHAAAYPEAPH
jgi:NodT family efflux transporter outer membrane factor (OMF) lipoprotein